MKKILLTALLGAVALAGAGCAAGKQAAMSEADVVTAQHVEKMLAERMYKVDCERAYPMAGPSFTLNYPYYVSVIGERVESFLPYFGRAYSVPYGGGEGLRFAAPITGYSETVRKNGRRLITFTARTEEDSYDFSLTVLPLGQCDVAISPSRKQTISFGGRIDLSPEFEAVRVE